MGALVLGQEGLLLQALWRRVPNASSSACTGAHASARAQLRHWHPCDLGHGQEGLVLRSPPCRLPNNPLPLRLQRRLLQLAAGLVGGQEGLLLRDAGQGLPAHGATDTAPTNDLIAIRLQCRVPWVLPLPDQAVVREQARMVLPAHGPWLPHDASSLMLRNTTEVCLEQ